MQPADQTDSAKQASTSLVLLSLLGVVLLWGSNVVMLKYLTGYYSPVALAAIRLPVATAFLLPISVWRYGWIKPSRQSWYAIAGVGLFSIFLHQLSLCWGLTATSGTNAVLILGLNPLVTTLLAALFANEPLNWQKGTGVLLGFSGVALIVMKNIAAASGTLLGDLSIVIAMLTYVIGSLCVKKATVTVPPLAVTAYSHILASIGLFAAGAVTTPVWLQEGALSFLPIAVLLFSGCICTGLGTIWWNNGVHRVGASTASLFLNLVTVVGMFASAIFLREALEWRHFAALALVILGVSLGTGALGYWVKRTSVALSEK